MVEWENIATLTGPRGDLAAVANVCGKINDAITRAFDILDGPDATDAFDASCNTCRHFQRTKFDRTTHSVSIFGFPGTCAQTGKSVTGWPRGIFCGHQCYENRRTGSARTSSTPQNGHFHEP